MKRGFRPAVPGPTCGRLVFGVFSPLADVFILFMRAIWQCGVLVLTLAGCSAGMKPVIVARAPCAQLGLASWYRPGMHRAADGERYGPDTLLAAHRWLPFGTAVRVTDVESGRSVVVRIDDRGPFVPGRIIDLSPEAAKRLGMRQDGVASVRLEISGRAESGHSVCPFNQAHSM